MASSSDPSRSPDDDDFSASRFRKTVCLYDWWLSQAADGSQERTLAVSGFASPKQQSVQQVVQVFKSAPITKRYDFATLETADGVCVVVSGLINKLRTTESGFSSEIFKHFVFGFPLNWEECASKCLEKEAKIVTRPGKESFDLSTLRGGNRKSEIHEDNSIRNATIVTIKRVTRSASKSSALSASRDYCGPSERNSDKCMRDTNENKHDAQLQNDFSPENPKSHLTSMDPGLPNVEVEGTQENHLSAAMDESKLYSPQKTGGKRTGKVNEDNSWRNATIITSRRVTRSGSKSFALSSSRDSSGLDRRSSGKYKRNATENKHDAQLPNDFSPQNTKRCLTMMDPNLHNAEMEGTQDSRFSAAVDESKVYSPQKMGGKGKGNVDNNTLCGEPIVIKTPTGSQGSSLTSPDSFKRSRSGRILLPRLEFWRNQVAVYALDRGVAGVQEAQV
ncbi:kinetochore-associated protein KNL-2 homolog [Syzygium oleosum]|uniref:kinetochore-associated protein KNL-2 homolog n=1 Tax=Syzygium oleosum TaxID=219896 RepID=UPI0024BAF5F4|nr:kinetochore-associated protein KNL-2 homolog [Syzygium oleosum]XP_056172590.1 kinetochore-associated protein KNL-2 homolog [Syzygium oleosum]XP_056172591.1 kinetochore-associated protein KNL-2 homolog [Syzygium oleosum]